MDDLRTCLPPHAHKTTKAPPEDPKPACPSIARPVATLCAAQSRPSGVQHRHCHVPTAHASRAASWRDRVPTAWHSSSVLSSELNAKLPWLVLERSPLRSREPYLEGQLNTCCKACKASTQRNVSSLKISGANFGQPALPFHPGTNTSVAE
jgi:hypothetical protein